MAKLAALRGAVQIDSGTGATTIAHITEGSLEWAAENPEATTLSSNGFRERIKGLRDASGTVRGFVDSDMANSGDVQIVEGTEYLLTLDTWGTQTSDTVQIGGPRFAGYVRFRNVAMSVTIGGMVTFEANWEQSRFDATNTKYERSATS